MSHPVVGRFAPSPTGPLHFGSLVVALGSWLSARSQGGRWHVRIEDIDPPREPPGAAQDILDSLVGFGLDHDGSVIWQSTRVETYAAALQTLIDSGHAYPCRCTRSDLAASAGRHGAACIRPWHHDQPHAWRLRLPVDARIEFEDVLQGLYTQNLRNEVGDFVLRRVDGLWAYQLAVVVDDAAQGITEVVRGADLLDSTPRQILLQRLLGLPTPKYLHLPLVRDQHGTKLSKSTQGPSVDPHNPMPVLRAALKFLGQDSATFSRMLTPRTLLDAACTRFVVQKFPMTTK